jgi:PAS domain S-box-containing protein
MKYRYLSERASDAMWLQDVQGRFLDGNEAFEKLTGFTVKEMTGVHLGPFLSQESLARAREVRQHLIKGESFDQPYEQVFFVKGGGTKPVQMSTNALVVDDEFIGFEHVARDMTREKEFEENVRAYIQQITMAQEDERKRVSRDLHDDVSPEILVLIKKLDALSDRSRLKVSDVRNSIKEVRGQAEKALEALRRTAQGLRPRIIDDLGLVAAVEWIAEEMEQEEHCTVEVSSSGMDREPSPEVQIVLFRITQEALNNIRKHARADKVTITITGQPDTISMEIADNGKGFTVPVHVEDTVRDGHLGLMGMDERARLLNGTLEISSAPGTGTRIRARLPWSVGT